MTQSSALPGFVALASVVAAFAGCSSSPASSAPDSGTGDVVGVAGNGGGAVPGTGSAGAGGTSTAPTLGGGGSSDAYGGSPGQAGTTGTSGNGTDTAGAGGSGLANQGGSHTIDVVGGAFGKGGASGSMDVVGGAAGSMDVVGGAAGSMDVVGGAAGSMDVVGGAAGSMDVVGGAAGSMDVVGGAAGSMDVVGGAAGSFDTFGGTGNTTNTGGLGPPPPPDAGHDGGLPCVPTWFAKKINVLVLHDANVSNADTRGGFWVGGNLTGVGYDVGADLPADPSCTRYDLAVGGNITLSGHLVLHSGAAAYGGSLDVPGVTGGTCGLYHAPADMPDFTQIAADVKTNSTYFAGLPATGTVNGTTFNGGDATCKTVVFNTSLCSFNYSVTIDVPAGGTAIINSTCTTVNFTSEPTISMGGVVQPRCSTQAGSGGACSHVLYNFPNATSITAGGGTVQGSILAPYANFTGDGGAVAGEVVVDSMNTGIEFHAWFFEGCLDTSVC